jgi:hypothetical protein
MSTPEKPSKKYKSYKDVWELRDGAILLYKRKANTNPNFQYRLKIRGKSGYMIESSNTRDFLEACKIAEDRYDDLRADVRRFGVEYISKRSWSQVWKQYDEEVLDLKVARGDILKKRKSKLNGVWNNWIKPYWGEMQVRELSKGTVRAYWKWRFGQNDAPNNTILDQAKVFKSLVKFARDEGYLSGAMPDLSPDCQSQIKKGPCRGVKRVHFG